MKRIVKAVRGATAIEYSLIAALIAMMIVAGANSFAQSTITLWNQVTDTTSNAIR